jgi:hypothetical protein
VRTDVERLAEMVSEACAAVESRVEASARRTAKSHEAELLLSLDRIEAAMAECVAHDDPSAATAERTLRTALDAHEQACRALVTDLRALPGSDAFDPLRALEVDVRQGETRARQSPPGVSPLRRTP